MTFPRRTIKHAHSVAVQGKRADLGRHFKSKMEANYARFLDMMVRQGEIHKWEYEPDEFWFEGVEGLPDVRRGVRSYKPDFKIWDKPDSTPYYVETKGWMCPKSLTRKKRMAKYYPHIKINYVTPKEYARLRKNVAPFIPNWE